MSLTLFIRTLGMHVRAARIERSMTQQQLARQAGVSERLVRSIELGQAKGVSLDKLSSVLSCLDLHLAIDGGDASEEAITQPKEYSDLLAQAAAEWSSEQWHGSEQR